MSMTLRQLLEFMDAAGAPPPPGQDVALPVLTDADSLSVPTIVPEQAILLPVLTDANTLNVPTVVPEQAILLPALADADTVNALTSVTVSTGLVLPVLVDADTLRLPIVVPEQAIGLPVLVDANTLNAPTVVGEQAIALPVLVDPDALNAPTLAASAANLTLPVLVTADVLFGPIVVPQPPVLALPFLTDADVLRSIALLTSPYTVHADLSHRFWKDDNPGPSRYVVGQTVGIVATFRTAAESGWRPEAVRFEVRKPDGTLVQYPYGDPDVGDAVGSTIAFELRVRPDVPGTWWVRVSADDASGLAHPTQEMKFRVRKSKFTGLG
jgi:hypothetical protein